MITIESNYHFINLISKVILDNNNKFKVKFNILGKRRQGWKIQIPSLYKLVFINYIYFMLVCNDNLWILRIYTNLMININKLSVQHI
jgi:hypothetical protein